MRQARDLWLCMSMQELITKQTLCNKQSWAEQDQFFGGLEVPDTLGLQEALLGLAGGFNQHRKQCTTVEKSWGWTMEQAVNKHFCLLPRSGDSRDPVVAAKNNCSPVIVAVWICETALLAPNSLMSPAHCCGGSCQTLVTLTDITGLSQLYSRDVPPSSAVRERKIYMENVGMATLGQDHCSTSTLFLSSSLP